MAYVKLTSPVRESIRRFASSLCDAEVKAVVGSVDSSQQIRAAVDPAAIERYFWREHAHLRDLLPDGWCTTASSVNLTIRDVPCGERLLSWSHQQITGAYKLPPRCSSMPHITLSYDSPYLDSCRPTLDRMAELAGRRLAISDKWGSTMTKVDSYLDNHASLNTALKDWPGLRMFIPDDWLNKVEAKVTRTTPKPKVPDVVAKAEAMKAQLVAEERAALESVAAVSRIVRSTT